MRFDSRASHPRTSGFTLIEVMAALVIVSLGMLAVIQAVSQAANNNAYLRDKTIAHWVAMNRITELRLAQQAPEIGESSGEVEMAGRRWRWQSEVTATAVTTMRRIDVRVSEVVAGATSDEAGQLALVSGFYGSKIAPPGTVRADFYAVAVAPSSSGSSSGGVPNPSSGGVSGNPSGDSSGSGGTPPRN